MYEELIKALRFCARWHRADDALANAEQAAAAIEALKAEVKRLELDNEDYEYEHRRMKGEIEALQAETVRLWPKRGKWINSKERMRPDMCSVCGCAYEADRFMDKIVWNYCPNCGAKMEVQE